MAESHNPFSVLQLVEGVFRHSAGQLTATLTRMVGRANIELVEEAIQEAMITALKVWPLRGVPDKPEAWLYTTARNKLIDLLKRESKDTSIEAESPSIDQPVNDSSNTALFQDDLLHCIFSCCHPSLPRESQATLTLRLVCGFSASEIARMLLINEESVTRRISRAKETFRTVSEPESLFEIASASERLHAVLDVIYFLLNAGHTAPEGDALIRVDLAEEARYLALTLSNHPATAKPETFALLALISFHLSRLPARTNEKGELLTLEEQNRSVWNKTEIETGFTWLTKAMTGTALTEYHLQAGIAAEHAKATSFEKTNWERIVEYYDMLSEINSSPVIALNRAVAYAHCFSIQRGLEQLQELAALPQMNRYYLYHAVHADLLRRNTQWALAISAYKRAISLVGNDVEKQYLQRRLNECERNL